MDELVTVYKNGGRLRKRKLSLYIFFLFALYFCDIIHAEDLPEKKIKPNVILLIFDAMRADHLSCYGYRRQTSPFLDRVSQDGALFLNHFSNATSTPPSMPSYLCSRYFSLPLIEESISKWGIRMEDPDTILWDFDKGQIFLPRVLSDHGYQTVFFHDHEWFSYSTFLANCFDESYYMTYHRNDELLRQASQWIKKNAAVPFFMYCHIMCPHQPYRQEVEEPEFLKGIPQHIKDSTRTKIQKRRSESTKNWTEQEKEILVGLYDSNIKHIDRHLAIFMHELEKLNLEKHTLIIITSDHGEDLGQHGIVSHEDLSYDSLAHVPLIMIYPSLIPSGTRVAGLTEAVDIPPTIFDLCEIPMPTGAYVEGVNLMPFIKGKENGKPEVYINGDSIRTQQYKYVSSEDLLFDVIADPGEKKDIARKRPEVAKKLHRKTMDLMERSQSRVKSTYRTEPPDYPFYFSIKDCAVSSQGGIVRYDDGETYECFAVFEKHALPDSWALNEDVQAYGLFFSSLEKSLPELELSVPVPDGKYAVSVLLEFPSNPPSAARQSRLETRFREEDSFSPAGEMHFIKEMEHGKKPLIFTIGISVRRMCATVFLIRGCALPSQAYRKE